MLEKFYPTHVIGRLSISEEEFWEEKVKGKNNFKAFLN